jgi:hypothetical protein
MPRTWSNQGSQQKMLYTVLERTPATATRLRTGYAEGDKPMSDPKPTSTTKVPDGRARFVTTRQKDPTEKGFVGFETVWEKFQKEAEYKTPKRP